MSTEAVCSKCKLSSPFSGSQAGKTVELKFCYRCGGELIIKRDMRCPDCNLSLSIHDKFCQLCGKDLLDTASKSGLV